MKVNFDMRALLCLLLTAAAVAAAAVACRSAAPRPAVVAPSGSVVAETWLTPRISYRNIDSLAVWRPSGEAWLLATEKSGDVLLAYDLATGAFVRTLSGRGSALGRLQRPDGIAISGDLVFVVERDNARLQVFRLPDGAPVGTFAAGDLRKPYGIALIDRGAGRLDVYVTDNDDTLDRGVTSPAVLGRRVHQYEVRVAGTTLSSRHIRAFGDPHGVGRLFVVETIAVDADHDQVLVADEATRDVKVYTLDGRYTGRAVGAGLFKMQPEGMVLAGCTTPAYWIMTDQDPVRNVFHVFDRGTLAHRGAFEGRVARGTDGVTFAPGGSRGLSGGALLAMHDDAQVAAYSWPDIQRAVGLEPCS